MSELSTEEQQYLDWCAEKLKKSNNTMDFVNWKLEKDNPSIHDVESSEDSA